MKLIKQNDKYTKASEALQAARNLIRDTVRWTRGSLAVRHVGGYLVECGTKAKQAEAFCALGAVKRVNGPAERSATAFLREAALHTLQSQGARPEDTKGANHHIFSVNDTERFGGHKSVLKMFARAIRQAKKFEQTK